MDAKVYEMKNKTQTQNTFDTNFTYLTIKFFSSVNWIFQCYCMNHAVEGAGERFPLPSGGPPRTGVSTVAKWQETPWKRGFSHLPTVLQAGPHARFLPLDL